MRLAKSSRTLLLLAFSAVLATCALAQEHPNVQPNAVRDQLMQQASGPSQAPHRGGSCRLAGACHGQGASAAPAAKAPAKAPAAAKGAAKGGIREPLPAEKPAEEKPRGAARSL